MTNEKAIEEVESAFMEWEHEKYTGDDWSEAHEARDMAIKALKDTVPRFHLECLRCKKSVGVYSTQTMEQVSYTHYSYCEDCLRKGLKFLKAVDEAVKDNDERLKRLKDQIYMVKHNMKSENSDYLTGYICALSAVEGMIAEVEQNADG